MSTATLEETLELPGGGAPSGVTAVVQLAADDGRPYPAGYATDGDGATIVGTYSVPVDPDTGDWSIDLTPNSEITPTGTVWRIRFLGNTDIDPTARYITLPAAGTYGVADVLTEPPGSIPPPELATEIAARTAGDDALDERLDAIEGLGTLATAADLADEADARAAADAALDSRIDAYDALGTLASVADLGAETARAEAAEALAIPLAQKNAASGVAPLDGSGLVPDANIPTGITRDTEMTTAVAAEATARDAAIAAAIAALIDSSPGTLDTLNELAAALGDDPNFAATITTALAGKQAASSTLDALAATSPTTLGTDLLEAANTGAAQTLLALLVGTDVQAWSSVLDATTAAFTSALATKLAGIATGATANSSDATLLARANHTGTQTASTISDFATSVAALASPAALIIPSDQTGDFTLDLTQVDNSIGVNKATGVTVTVPPNSSVAWPIGKLCELRQVGAGQLTVAPGSGVTLRSPGNALKSRLQYSAISLLKVDTDAWSAQGDLTT